VCIVDIRSVFANDSPRHTDSGAYDSLEHRLLQNIKAQLPELQELLERVEGHWGIEDTFYRYYHQSFKVFEKGQWLTREIVTALQALLPERELNKW
jgi:hypothetical protein